jgi:GTP-binding protein Era
MPDFPIKPPKAAKPFRSGFVALIGRPNVGKSTLLNSLVGQVVAISTPRPQTTRGRVRGILTTPEFQVVFVDTPGMHRRERAINRYLLAEAQAAVSEVDLVTMVVEAQGRGKNPEDDPEDRLVLDIVRQSGRPAIVAINKIDRLKEKRALLPIMQAYAQTELFTELVPISARTGDGIAQLLAEIVKRLPEGPQLYPSDQITDQPERVLAAEFIREQVIIQLGDELPYSVAVVVDTFEEIPERDLTKIRATIFVEHASQKGILIGKGGQRLKSIGTKARASIETMRQGRVYLELYVKVSDRWTRSTAGLRKVGYHNT